MKDYIDITTSDGNVVRMEVVTIFKLEGFTFKYIIYKTLDGKHFYVAKFYGEELVNLNTELSEREMKLCNGILEGVMKNAIRG